MAESTSKAPVSRRSEAGVDSLRRPPVLSGLTLHEEIGRGAFSVVYRASRGHETYAVKVQRPRRGEDPAIGARRFRREGALVACMRHPGLPKVLELGEADGRSYIVLELVRGNTLAELIEEGPLPNGRIIAIARQIAGALGCVHQMGLVHCDVKPANILVGDRAAGEWAGARLIDFGFAIRATGDRPRGEVAGTLLYAAPEQSGMLKRPLDGRSDLYALGVVLFECATGAPPFQADDVGELVRQHAVAPLPDIRELNAEISQGLEAVIGRLLAKDPDDRYQSPGDLIADLDRLEGSADGEPLIGELASGVEDSDSRTLAPLVGRERELKQLLQHHEATRRGTGSLLLLSGARGIGKTRLVAELVERARARGDLTLVGGCLADSVVPFLPLREAVDGALRRLQRGPASIRDEAEDCFRRAVGDLSGLLHRFSPQLSRLLADRQSATGPGELQDQYYDAVAHFFAELASEADGALLVVENAHVLDAGSREVLLRLARLVPSRPLLLLLTADLQHDQDDSVAQLREDLGSATTTIELAALDDAAISSIVAGRLGDSKAKLDFASRVVSRSNGHPLTALELVHSMLDAGLLRPSWGQWILDDDGLEQLALGSDVVELVVRRIEGLPETTQRVLSAAAVIGTRFDRVVLTALFEEDEDVDVNAAIGEAVAERVLERGAAGRYGFIHADVRDALVATFDEAGRRALHQHIATVLDEAVLPELENDTSEHLYAVAQHYALGDASQDPERVVRAAVRAGRRALDEYAHEQAHTFLQQARTTADQAEIELEGDFHEVLGEVSARTGRLAEAIQHYEHTLNTATEPLERARLRARLAHSHIANFHARPAWREVEAGFAELGVSVARGWWQLLAILWFWLRGRLAVRRKGKRNDHRRSFDAVYVELCEQGALSAYFNSHPLRLGHMVLRAMHAAVRLGPGPALAMTHAQHGVFYAACGLRSAALRSIERAVGTAEQTDDRLSLARCELYYAFVLHLCGDSIEAEAQMERALDEHGHWLDSMHYVDGCGDLTFNLLLRGYYRKAWYWVERQLPRLWFTSGGVRERQGNPWAAPLLIALGRTTEGVAHERQTHDFVQGAPRDERYLWGEMLSYRVLFLLEQGELGPAIEEAIDQHRALGLRPRWTSFHMRSFFLFCAYVRLEQAMRAPQGDRDSQLEALRDASRELRQTAMTPAMEAHALLIEGARMRLLGNLRQARKLFVRADRIARDQDIPWVQFEIARQRAHLLSTQGKSTAAEREARLARQLAAEHGWVPRVRKIRRELHLGDSSSRMVATTDMRETSEAGSLKLRRQLDALLQLSLAAGNVLDPQEQARKALDELVKILGAERAYLFTTLPGTTELQFEAGRDATGLDLDEPRGFSSTVVETVRSQRQPVVVSGSDDGASLGSESLLAHDLRSIVAAPLLIRDQLAGVIYLDSRLASGVFTRDDVEILVALGNHIAVALDTARTAQLEIQVEAEAQKRQLAERLRDTSHALSSTLKLDEVLDRLLEGIRGAVAYDRVTIYLVEQGKLRRVHSGGQVALEDEEKEEQEPLEPSDGSLLAEVVRRAEPRLCSDVRRRRPMEQTASRSLPSWLAVPLITHDEVAAVMVLESAEVARYDVNDAEIASTFAGQAAIAVENARLFGEVQRLARVDELTGILNRRHFFDLAERELARARRSAAALCVVMLDVDHFKQVNDTHGHAVGDEVLRVIARRCSECTRAADLLGRYGGEEFALLLPDTPLQQASGGAAERIRRSVADEPIATEAGPLKVTVSLGVAQLASGDEDFTRLLARADAALYRAKAGGRNRVEIDEPDASAPSTNSEENSS